MAIAVLAAERSYAELVAAQPAAATWTRIASPADVNPNQVHTVVDLLFDQRPGHLNHYAGHTELTVIGGAVVRSLTQQVLTHGTPVRCTLYGLNALPTFLERPVWEVSHLPGESPRDLVNELGLENLSLEWVPDAVGMVAPRVLAMIINEAYWLLQEGSAEADAINTALKLGTNYPYGPLEWAERIGVGHVYRLLKALQQEQGATRVRISRALEQAALTEVG